MRVHREGVFLLFPSRTLPRVHTRFKLTTISFPDFRLFLRGSCVLFAVVTVSEGGVLCRKRFQQVQPWLTAARKKSQRSLAILPLFLNRHNCSSYLFAPPCLQVCRVKFSTGGGGVHTSEARHLQDVSDEEVVAYQRVRVHHKCLVCRIEHPRRLWRDKRRDFGQIPHLRYAN